MNISDIELLVDLKAVSACINGKLQLHKEILEVDEFMKEQLNNGIINFIFNFSNVSMLSSYALAIFSMHMNSIHENSGKFIIYDPHTQAENTLRLVSFHKKVVITNTYKEALECLEGA